MNKELNKVVEMQEYDESSNYDSEDDSDEDDSQNEDDDSFDLNQFDPTKSFELSLGKGAPKKNKKTTTSDEAFRAKINPFSANLKTIIGQLESDSTTLSDLHKKFSDQLYRLRVEEALLEKLQQDSNNKHSSNDGDEV
ncbi:hypothetical protein ACTFIV_000343 [Dictyostelium citrinum]